MVEYSWELTILKNGFLVDEEIYFAKLEDAIQHIKERIDSDIPDIEVDAKFETRK